MPGSKYKLILRICIIFTIHFRLWLPVPLISALKLYTKSGLDHNVSSWLLKQFTVSACTTQSGKEFQILTTLLVKKNLHLRISYLALFFFSLRSCPCVTCECGLGNIGAAKLSYFPDTILYVSIISPRIRL